MYRIYLVKNNSSRDSITREETDITFTDESYARFFCEQANSKISLEPTVFCYDSDIRVDRHGIIERRVEGGWEKTTRPHAPE